MDKRKKEVWFRGKKKWVREVTTVKHYLGIRGSTGKGFSLFETREVLWLRYTRYIYWR